MCINTSFICFQKFSSPGINSAPTPQQLFDSTPRASSLLSGSASLPQGVSLCSRTSFPSGRLPATRQTSRPLSPSVWNCRDVSVAELARPPPVPGAVLTLRPPFSGRERFGCCVQVRRLRSAAGPLRRSSLPRLHSLVPTSSVTHLYFR